MWFVKHDDVVILATVTIKMIVEKWLKTHNMCTRIISDNHVQDSNCTNHKILILGETIYVI